MHIYIYVYKHSTCKFDFVKTRMMKFIRTCNLQIHVWIYRSISSCVLMYRLKSQVHVWMRGYSCKLALDIVSLFRTGGIAPTDAPRKAARRPKSSQCESTAAQRGTWWRARALMNARTMANKSDENSDGSIGRRRCNMMVIHWPRWIFPPSRVRRINYNATILRCAYAHKLHADDGKTRHHQRRQEASH